MNDQLLLKFPQNKVFLKDDFYVSKSNKKAFDLIDCWPRWIRRIVNIYGPRGSGKTHLASILKNKTRTMTIESKNLKDQTFFEFKLTEVLVLENLQETISENLLFSLYNFALQDNKYILITSKKSITEYSFKLPDLKSRIKDITIIGIDLPSDDLIGVILSKNFSDKQIKVEKRHIDYIVKRIDRSYEKISQFILTLDKYSLKKGSPFSLKLIKEVIKMI